MLKLWHCNYSDDDGFHTAHFLVDDMLFTEYSYSEALKIIGEYMYRNYSTGKFC